MDEASDILSFDYAMDDELKDESHEVETVPTNQSTTSTKNDNSDAKKAKGKSNEIENGDDSKVNSKSSSAKKSTGSKANGKASPTKSTNNKKDSTPKNKSSTSTSSATDSKLSKDDSKAKEEKGQGPKLYVSGIGEETKASDLQDLFAKHAKILDAKIIRFSKIPNQCFGLVTFDGDSQLEKCSQSLNKGTLKGCTITLSKNSPLKTFNNNSANSSSGTTKTETSTKPVKKTEEQNDKPKATEDVKSSAKETPKEKEKPSKDSNPPSKKDASKTSNDSKSSASKVSTKVAKPTSASQKNAKPEVKKSETNNKDSKAKPKVKDSKEKEKEKEREKEREKEKQKERERERQERHRRERSSSGERRRSPYRRPVISISSHSIRNSINQSRIARMQEIRQREELESIKAERIRFQKEKERLQYERLKLEREKLEFLRLEREKILKEREEVARRRQLVEEHSSKKRSEHPAVKRTFDRVDSRDGGGPPAPVHFQGSSRRDDSGSRWIDSSRFDSRDARNSGNFNKRNKYETNLDYDNRRHGSNSHDRDDRKEFRRESRERRFEDSRRDHRYSEKDNGNGLGLDSARVFNSGAEPRTNWVAPIAAAQWTSSSESRWSSNFDTSHPQSALSPSIITPPLNSMSDSLHYSSSYAALPLNGMSAPYNLHQNRRFQ